MFEHKSKVAAAVALAASFMMVLCAFAIAAPGSNADTGADLDTVKYGAASEIAIAPGYQWSYTTTFPSDLEEGTTLSFATDGETVLNELGSNATLNGHTLTVKIPANMDKGKYNIVLMAEHEASGQTEANNKAVYQWIRLNVGSEMTTDYSEHITQILKSASQELTLKAETTVEGTIEWTMDTASSSPGFELKQNTESGEWKVTGAPENVGANVIKLTAKLMIDGKVGETKELNIEFTVYNIIKVGDGDGSTINAIGGVGDEDTVLLAGVEQDGIGQVGDVKATWATNKALPTGLKLDESTGAITGSYTAPSYGSLEFTLTVSSNAGPKQSESKVVTINFEPALTFGDVKTVKSWVGNSDVTGEDMKPETEHSEITYSLESEITGIDVDTATGALIVKGTAAATASGTATVVAATEYGQTVKKSVSYIVEEVLTAPESAKIVSYIGHSNSITITTTGPAISDYKLSDDLGKALTFDKAKGELSLSSQSLYSEADKMTVTLTVISDAGQEKEIAVQIVNYSALKFTSAPSADGIFAYVS